MAKNSEEKGMIALARMHGLEYVPPRLIDTRGDLADLLPEAIARECNVLPQAPHGTTFKILMSDPLDFETIDRVRFCRPCGPIEIGVASVRAIRDAIERVYGTPGL